MRRRSEVTGQSMVEFALIAPIVLGMFALLVNGGFALETGISLTNSARVAARYAIVNPESWSNAVGPPADTIEGQAMVDPGVGGHLASSEISVAYYDMSTSPAVECGYYSPSTGAFVAESGYTEATCVITNNEVEVTLSATYNALTGPLDENMPLSFPIVESSTMLIEVTPP